MWIFRVILVIFKWYIWEELVKYQCINEIDKFIFTWRIWELFMYCTMMHVWHCENNSKKYTISGTKIVTFNFYLMWF